MALVAAFSPLALAPLSVHADTLSIGDVLIGGLNGQVYHYDPHGQLLGVLDTQSESAANAPSQETGMCFDAALDLYTTNFEASTMTEFTSQGAIASNPWAANFNTSPMSCVRDSAGNTYVGSTSPGDLRKFSPTGNLLATYAPTKAIDGVDWIDLGPDGCTLYYTSAWSSIFRYNVCTATQLTDFADNISTNCAALHVRSGGDVFVACPDAIAQSSGVGVYHLDATGKVIQFYAAGSFNQVAPYGLALDVDGTSFWVSDGATGALDKVDIETGRVLVQVESAVGSGTGGGFESASAVEGTVDVGTRVGVGLGLAVVPGPPQPDPPVAASLPAAQNELIVCGNAPVSPLPSASSTPCARTLSGSQGWSTVTGTANVDSTQGGLTVAGRGAPPNGSLQVQYVPAGSTVTCASNYWTAASPGPPGSAILGTVTADGNGNYASAGALVLPSPTAVGQAQLCVLQPPVPQTTTPTGSTTIAINVVSGTGPGSCLQSSTGHNGFVTATGQGAWWNGDPGAVGPTGGVYARISNYNPSTAAATGDVTASTMIYAPAPATSPDAVRMAQTGWTKGDLHFPPGTPPQQFAEYVDSTAGVNGVDVFVSGVSGATLPTGTTQQAGSLGTAVVGDSDYYATLFDPTTQLTNALDQVAPGEFEFFVDNTLVASIPGTFTPIDTRVGTAVHAGADQIAGGVSDPEHFTDVYAYEPAGPPASGSSTQRWQSFDKQAVTPVVTPLVSAYAQMSAASPAAGATVDTWDSTCSM